MVKYSGTFHFNQQLKQEGSLIKINEQENQLIDNIFTPIKAIVRNTGVENKEGNEERSIIIGKEYDYKAGDYVEYLGDTYITTTCIDKDNPFFNTAKMKRCNYNLKWMYNGNLYETMSIITNQTKYTLGISTIVAGITEGDSRYVITLPYNSKTKNIKVGQRFIFNSNAWKATQTDFVSEVGIMSVLLGQDSINNEIDNTDLEIAGYYANKHTYVYDIPTSINVEKYKSINLVYSIKDETGKEFDYSLVTVKNTSNLIQVDNNKGVISIKGLDIGTGSITLSVPSGEVSKEFAINFEVKSVVPDKIEYKVISSNAYTFIKMVGAEISVQKLINGVADTTLKVDYKVPTNIQTLITNGSLSITTKSDNSIYIRNKSVTTPTTFVIEFFDKATNSKICESPTITLKGA